MKIAIGSDHAGYSLKEEIAGFLEKEQIELKDFGVHSPEPADYPDTGALVAEAVARGEFDRGILVCATGIGMSIVANKVPGIRAALCTSVDTALLSREHNDANILVLGGRVTDTATGIRIVRAWFHESFSEEQRHVRRIQKIKDIERRYSRSGG